MKKLLALAIAGCFVLGSLGVASAIDVKVNGQYQFHWGYYSHADFMKHDKGDGTSAPDRLRFRQRMRTQIRFIADENLSAMLNVEIGDLNWGDSSGTGRSKNAGGLDADGYDFKVKHAYLDWTLPNTQVKSRIGVQGLRLPWSIAGNPIMDADVAGVTVSTQFTPEVGLTVFYARPYDGLWGDETTGPAGNRNDEMDMLGFMVPIKTSSIRATPWAMGAMIGREAGYWAARGRYTSPYNVSEMDSDGYGYWFGTTFEMPMLDPFIVKIDAMAGGLRTGDSDSNTFGYFLVGQLGYKFSFGTLSLKGWYSSGDDASDDKGTMPIISDDNGFLMTPLGLNGQRWRAFDSFLSPNGLGMWGVQLELANVSFVDKLSHRLAFTWMRGTNKGDAYEGNETRGNYYLTSDSAYEINLENQYKVTPNLTLALDFHWIDVMLSDQRRLANGDKMDSYTHGMFSTQLAIQYAF